MKAEEIAVMIVDNLNLSSDALADYLIKEINPATTSYGRTELTEVLRKYKDTRTGLEVVAGKARCILGAFDFDACDDPVGDYTTKHKIDIDKVTFFTDQMFTDPEEATKIVSAMEWSGIEVDLNLVEEVTDDLCEYAIFYKDKTYTLQPQHVLEDLATDTRAESISSNAYDMARDEVSELSLEEVAESAGYYSVEEIVVTENGDDLLVVSK
jgi:hypothetical protein